MHARDHFKTVENFHRLPDDAGVHPQVAIIMGVGERDAVYNHPELERFKTGPRSLRIRVRSIRKVLGIKPRAEAAPA